jgi:RND family efflux transporter MFP subunit
MAGNPRSLEALRIDRSAPTRRKGPIVWVTTAALVLAVAGFEGWRWWSARANRPIVRAAAVQEAGLSAGGAAVLNASGYVTARRRATVSSKVTGRVIEVLVEEGQPVRQGQVLARLDPTTAQANLGLTQAQLGAARRALDETEVRLQESRVSFARQQNLMSQGLTTQADFDAAKAQVDALDARLNLAREQVRVAEQQVRVIETDLENMVITAPFSGVAISKDAQPGEMVSPMSAGGGFTRTGLCTIVDMSSLEIEVDVNETYLNRVTPKQRVEAVLDAYPEWRIPAHVITTVPTGDRQKATVKVRVGFDRLDPRILPDLGVKVAFMGEDKPEAAQARPTMLVPRSAISKDGGQDVVYVVKDANVERRVVKLGPAQGDALEVMAGLSSGERVVVETSRGLKDGEEVTVR